MQPDRPPLRVALVGCGKSKRSGVHPARDLYTGNLVRAALGHAERTANQVFIVSALYGLVEPARRLQGYELSIATLSKEARESWASSVVTKLISTLRRPMHLSVYAGVAYADPIATEARHHGGWLPVVEQPLRGLGIGERLRWFKQQGARHAA